VRLRSELITEVQQRRHVEAQARDLEQALDKAQSEVARKQQLLDKSTDEVSHLVKQLDARWEVHNDVQAQLTNCQEAKLQLEGVLEQRDSEIDQLQRLVEQKNNEIRQLRGLDSQRKQYDEVLEVPAKKTEASTLTEESTEVLVSQGAGGQGGLTDKLVQLEDQLRSLQRAEVKDSKCISLQKLREIEVKLSQTNEKYDSLAEQIGAITSPSHEISRITLKARGGEKKGKGKKPGVVKCTACRHPRKVGLTPH
jgi:DNA repair exonuclease SbcCD ATPase subunit